MASKKYNVGVIGYGLSAKVFHIPFILLNPSLNLHSIVQRTPKPQDDASVDFPSIKLYSSATELFANHCINIVVVTTTPETHFPFTKSALEAGKHVLVEKPFVPTSAEAHTLAEISKKTGRLICVYQNRRWDSDFLTIRKLLSEDKLGRIWEFHTHFDRYKAVRPENWKGQLRMDQAGGVLYDLGSHLIDQAYVLFGLPHSVTAFFANQRNDGAAEPDGITVMLGYGAAGPLVTVKAAVMSVETGHLRFWVRGTRGSYEKYYLDTQEDQLREGIKPNDAAFGVEPVERDGILTVFGTDGKSVSGMHKNVKPETYMALYAQFIHAIEAQDADQVPVKAEEAGDVLRIIEAAKESAKNGKTIDMVGAV